MQNTQNEERLSSPALVAGNESTLGENAPPLPASGAAASSAGKRLVMVCDKNGQWSKGVGENIPRYKIERDGVPIIEMNGGKRIDYASLSRHKILWPILQWIAKRIDKTTQDSARYLQ
jgi:hypothetical protein